MIPLSDAVARPVGYVLCALAVVLGAVGIREYALAGDTAKVVENLLLPAAFGAVIIVLLRTVPRHGVLWTLLPYAVIGTLHESLKQVGSRRLGLNPEYIGETDLAPASLGVLDALTVSFVQWGWLWLVALILVLMVLFPTGRPATRVSNAVLWIALLATAVASAVGAVSLAPGVETPYAVLLPDGAWLPIVSNVFFVLAFLSAVAIGDLGWRFRRSSGVERLQFRWVATALSAFMLTVVGPIPVFYMGIQLPDLWWSIVPTTALAAIPVSIGIAISRHRLFDIDLVISRTLLFVTMAGLITVTYAGFVVGLGSLVGGSTLIWRIAVTALVAVLFEPVRHRIQRRVNRLVFGRRAAPYEVLTDLTDRLATAADDNELLVGAARRLVDGTGAERATVWTVDEAGFLPTARAPRPVPTDDGGQPPARSLDELPGVVAPIVEDGETLGALSVEPRRGVTLTSTERHLVEDLAGSVGLVMRRLRLDAELRQKAVLLEESRRRLVNAQELERRRLQRRLDEDARQKVIALSAQLDSSGELARQEGSNRTAALIDQMAAETEDAIAQIEALVQGLHPPLLEAEGLAAALAALAESAPVEVQLDAGFTARHPLPVEAAAYFCIAEALTNALKHGRGPVSIMVADRYDVLSFAVTDSGPGFDPTTVTRGAGLRNLAERVEPLGGSVRIDTEPGRPTVIVGRLPIGTPAPLTVGA